jgi:hypothetical protein
MLIKQGTQHHPAPGLIGFIDGDHYGMISHSNALTRQYWINTRGYVPQLADIFYRIVKPRAISLIPSSTSGSTIYLLEYGHWNKG